MAEIVPATEMHWRAARMLLPEALHHGCGYALWVATEDSKVIAAAAMDAIMRGEPLTGPKVAVHVARPWRGRGFGRGLLSTVASAASRRGVKALYAWAPVDPESEEHLAWRAMGFSESLVAPVTTIDNRAVERLLAPIYQRLLDRHDIPGDARVISLREADLEQAAALQVTYLGGTREIFMARALGHVANRLHPELSRVLLKGDRVVGLLLARPKTRTECWLEANVLHPCVRGKWANVMLKLDAARTGLKTGVEVVLYEAFGTGYADSLKFGERMAGTTRQRCVPYAPLPLNAKR